MNGGHIPESEYPRSRLLPDPHAVDATQHAPPTTSQAVSSLPELLRSTDIGASYNTPMRAQRMQQMQGTHGNRAVQRALGTSLRTTSTSLRPVQRDRFTRWAKDLGEDAWNWKHNPLKDPVDSVRNLFGGGDNGPTAHDIVRRHQLEVERMQVLLRNKEQIEKEYGPSFFSVLMTNAGIPAIPIPQQITDMDKHRQQQEHDASIDSAQKALTGEVPGAMQGAPGVAKPDEIYPDMVSK